MKPIPSTPFAGRADAPAGATATDEETIAAGTGGESGVAGATDELVLVVGECWHRLHQRHRALAGRARLVGGSEAEQLARVQRQVADAYALAGRALDAARPGATATTAELAGRLREARAAAEAALAASAAPIQHE